MHKKDTEGLFVTKLSKTIYGDYEKNNSSAPASKTFN
jgi:hypothetical protein